VSSNAAGQTANPSAADPVPSPVLNAKLLLTWIFIDCHTTCNAQRSTGLHRRIKHSP
jgi:hypothetical protein